MLGTRVLQQNYLLAALPSDVLARLLPYFEIVHVDAGQVLYETGAALRWTYFPADAVVALCHQLESGDTAGAAIVGNDGVVGFAAFMGGESAVHRAMVLGGGVAYRIRAQQLLEEFNRHGPLMLLVLRYMQMLLTQIAQTAVCNRHHSVDRQLCRWLLLLLDRHAGSEILITQASIASLLGVRRESVTEAALQLQRSGVIDYRRGRISVLNRTGLEKRCCECYAVVGNEASRLLPRSVVPVASIKRASSKSAASFAAAQVDA